MSFFAGCHRHHGCCCNDCGNEKPQGFFEQRTVAAPVGPIVESYAMMQQMPMMMAMPMMMGMQVTGMSSVVAATQTRPVTYQTQTRTEATSDVDQRLNDLDKRVDALDKRMQTIQGAVEIQTRILEEIKARGSIGNQPIPSSGS